MGLVDLVAQTVSAARPHSPRAPGRLTPLQDAALGFALAAQRRSLSAVVGTADRAGRWARAATRLFVPPAVLGAVDRRIRDWGAWGAMERARAREEAGLLARTLVGAVTAAVLDEVDLDAVADRLDVDRVAQRADLDALLTRVDLDSVLARVDLDAVLARVDVDALLARIDLDAVVGRVDLDAVAGRVDLDAVADRLDMDRVVGRVDLDAVLDRVDLVTHVEQVLEALDVGRIVRDTGGSITAETLDAVRDQNARADRFVDRITDRLLRRGGANGDAAPRRPAPDERPGPGAAAEQPTTGGGGSGEPGEGADPP
ncbi:hypothetical protein LK07_27760 [Streptomyces pluripotens]|uniref:Uncharacterized protein n=1 Tax=Streptomyces pluripotens TaxID=1355015 RepID=A0A221P528_9ACTN|nr:hypothetical protein LK06_026600 [Streptomyces pluripotens]ASN27196.1 hypothetical protein LK07_27760 [Streptomyces pluripotens]